VNAAPAPASAAGPAFSLAAIGRRLDELAAEPARAEAGELLRLGEAVLEHWARARGHEPTDGRREGFRLLALHRQGADQDPSFNACRETCRELAWHYNLLTLEPADAERLQRQRMMTLVAKHLYLFVSGKMETQKLGEFCCSSRPLRTRVDSGDGAGSE
jgi:hypothetical protein